jgi:hypothetical protein
MVRQTKIVSPVGRSGFLIFRKRSKRMFSVGEFVVYGTTGVCLIEEIGTLQMAGISKEEAIELVDKIDKDNLFKENIAYRRR